jgi:hypothetical protein
MGNDITVQSKMSTLSFIFIKQSHSKTTLIFNNCEGPLIRRTDQYIEDFAIQILLLVVHEIHLFTKIQGKKSCVAES